MKNNRINASLAGLLVFVLTAPAFAAPQSNSVRNRMRKILDSPEYRNIVPLKPQGRPRTFTRGGSGGGPGGEGDFHRDENGNPVIVRDDKGRAKIGKDNEGRAVIGKDAEGRDVVLRDQQGREFVVRDGKPGDEEALRDRIGRHVLVRDDNDKAPIEKDRFGRAVIGKDQAGRDIILRDERGREVVVRDGKGRQGIEKDQFGRRIVFRDENGRAEIRRDRQGRAILGKDENGRDVVLRDANRRDVAARNDDGRDGILRDRQGRPVIFRDENQRARFKRNPDKRGNIGRDAQGRDVQVRDQQGRDVFVFDDDEFRKLPQNNPADVPPGGGNGRFGQNNPNNGGNGGGFDGNPGGGGGERNVDINPKDSSTSSSSGPTIQSSGLGAAVGGIFQVIGWIIAAIAAGAMLYLIGMGIVALVSGLRNRDKEISAGDTAVANDPMEPDKSPGELPADVYLQRARELASAGKFREAIAQLLLGGMSNLERAGIVKYRKGLTHRDYVRASRSQPQFYQAMRSMVRLYEPLGFGRRTPAPQHFEQSLSAYEAGFRAAPPATK